MVQRNPRSEFVGGAFVFPGGAVDPSDADLARFVFEVGDEEASTRLGVDSGGLAWLAAAARELYEEAGVLLAVDQSGVPIDPEIDQDLAEDLAEKRARLNAKETTFSEILDSLGLLLDVRGLHFFSHWVTPPGQPRRYDTRFFLCRIPSTQRAVHEGKETTESVWISPGAALEAASKGEMTIIFPTLKNLERLASFGSVEELLGWASEYTPQVVRPRVKFEDGSIRILIPGDEGYEEAREVQ
jgi:8-oxo-dGTP pyrophosphatase MutT (NUDIX family)